MKENLIGKLKRLGILIAVMWGPGVVAGLAVAAVTTGGTVLFGAAFLLGTAGWLIGVGVLALAGRLTWASVPRGRWWDHVRGRLKDGDYE